MEGQRPCYISEETRSVKSGNDDLRWVDHNARCLVKENMFNKFKKLWRGRHGEWSDIRPGEKFIGSSHQLINELLFPGSPCRTSCRKRISFGESAEDMKSGPAWDRAGNRFNRARVGEIPTSSGIGQEVVMLDQILQDLHVIRIETKPRANLANKFNPNLCVIAGKALPNVVKERAQHKEVRTINLADKLRGV